MGFGCCCAGKTCKNAGSEITSQNGKAHAGNYLEILNKAGLSSQAGTIQGGTPASSFAYGIDASNDYVVYGAGDAGIVYQKIGEGSLTKESLGFSSSSKTQKAYDTMFDENFYPITTSTNSGSRYGFESTPFAGAYDVCFISKSEILIACGKSGVKYFDLENKTTKEYLSGGSGIIRSIAKYKSYIITGTAGYTNPASDVSDNDIKGSVFPESVYVNVSNESGGAVNIYKIENDKLQLKTSASVAGSVNDICSGSKYAYVAYGSITSDDGSSSSGGISKIKIKSENDNISAETESIFSGGAVMACQAEGEDIYYVADSSSVLHKNESGIGKDINFKQTSFCARGVTDENSVCFFYDKEAPVVRYDLLMEEWYEDIYCFDGDQNETYEHTPGSPGLFFNWWGGCPMGISVTKDKKDDNGQVEEAGKIYVSLWQKGIVVCSKEGEVEKKYENFGGDNAGFCSSFGNDTKNFGTTIFSGKSTCNDSGVYIIDCFQAIVNDCGPNIYNPLMKKLFFLENSDFEQPIIETLQSNGDYGVGVLTF
jgi:hypothetical protein